MAMHECPLLLRSNSKRCSNITRLRCRSFTDLPDPFALSFQRRVARPLSWLNRPSCRPLLVGIRRNTRRHRLATSTPTNCQPSDGLRTTALLRRRRHLRRKTADRLPRPLHLRGARVIGWSPQPPAHRTVQALPCGRGHICPQSYGRSRRVERPRVGAQAVERRSAF